MELLAKTSPSETHLLLKQNKAEFKDLLKFTFIDLVRKNVLEPIKVTKGARGRTRTNTYVHIGSQFKHYQPSKHEIIYLSPFQKSPSVQIHIKSFVKMSIENSGGLFAYRKAILSSSNLSSLIDNRLIPRIFNWVKLTPLGVSTKKEIANYLRKLEDEIPELLKNNQKEALKRLLAIQGNFYLLNNLDFELLNQIDSDLVIELNRQYQNSYNSFSDIDYWYALENYSNSFDNGYDSAGYDSGSGCSSCSGCGGCGGCGN